MFSKAAGCYVLHDIQEGGQIKGVCPAYNNGLVPVYLIISSVSELMYQHSL